MSQSPDIGQNSDWGISEIRISGQSLIKENCHNSRTSDDIDMNLGPVTKLDKRNKAASKKFDDNVMSGNYDVIVIFRSFGQFGAVRRPDPDTESTKVMFSVKVTFWLTKTENRTKKSPTQLSHYCFESRYFFGQKTLIFCKKILTSAKLRRPRH